MRVAKLIVLTIWLQGCRSLGFDPGMRDLPEVHFQGLRRVYEHCRVSAERLFSLVVRRVHEAPPAYDVSEASAGLAVIASGASSPPTALLVKAR